MEFIPNISTLFREEVFLNRFDEVKKYGFNAVEIQSPYECSIESILKKKQESGVQIILINCCTADDFGCASIPGRDMEFMTLLSKSLDYTFKLGVQKLHILAGVKDENFTEDEQFNCMVNNLQTISETLENHNLIGLIEPLCQETKPNYYLDSFEKAVKILNEVNKENIKLLLDIYHLKKIEGDVTPEILQKYFKYAGHIQISQDPGRREPFSKNGSINYADVFAFLKQQNYKGYIGLEYFATESTSESLKWLIEFSTLKKFEK